MTFQMSLTHCQRHVAFNIRPIWTNLRELSYHLVLFGRIFADLLDRVAHNTPDTKGWKMGR